MPSGNGLATLHFDAAHQVAQYVYESKVTDNIPVNVTLQGSVVTLPLSSTWNAAAYGNGTIVLIGNTSDYLYSTDEGDSWVQGSMPANFNWRCVAYGSGIFLAVCNTAGISATSTDGITWTQRVTPNQAWLSIAFGNGVFVITANGAVVYTSDGITYNSTSMPVSMDAQGLAFGNGIFVASSVNSSVAATSPDGVNWTQQVLSSVAAWTKIAYNGNLFMATSVSSSVCSVSTDGATWVEKATPQSLYGLSAGNGIFFACIGTAAFVYTSSNGSAWWKQLAVKSLNYANSVALAGKTIFFPSVGSEGLSIPNKRVAGTLQIESSAAKPVVGSNTASVTVTGQAYLQATDSIEAWIQGSDSTADHNTAEHSLKPFKAKITNVIAGVGFDILGISNIRLDGDFKVRWAWSS